MRSLLGGAVRALAATPVPFVSTRMSRPAPLGGSPERSMAAYGSVGTLFAIVNRLANTTSQVDWHLYRQARSGLEEDRTEVTVHAALDLWNTPNPFMGRQEFVEGFQQHVDLTGEGWWVLMRSGRSAMPLSMFYVRPDRIAPVPHPTKYLAGYVYVGPDGEKVPLDLNEVIQLRMPNPLDQYRGLGPVQAAMIDVDSARYSAEWNRNFFINDATPGGLIKVDRRLGDNEWKEMTERWREQHQGVANAHRVAVLEQAEWVDRSFSMKDMQFVELRNVSRELIREAFGFPKPLLGATDDVNRANAEAAEVVYARWLMVPRLERIKGALNRKLLPLYGPTASDTYEFDYDDPTPQDILSEMAELTARVQAAALLLAQGYNSEDVLKATGLPDMAMLAKPAPAWPPAPGLAPGAKPTEPTPDPDAVADLVARSVLAARERTLASAVRLPRAHTHRTPELPAGRPPLAQDDPVRQRQLEAVQADWEQVLEMLWGDWAHVREEWYDSLTYQVRAAVEAGDAMALAEMSVDTAGGANLLASAMRQLAALSAQRVVDEAAEQGVQLEPAEPDTSGIEDFAKAMVTLMAGNVAASAAREGLRRRQQGVTADQVADGVRGFLDALQGAADRDQIGGALTNAQNTARIGTLESGPTAAYYADETLDKNTCQPCRYVDGKWLGNTIEQVREVYPTGGYIECEGRERCRGTVVAVWRGGDDPSEWIEKEPIDVNSTAWG